MLLRLGDQSGDPEKSSGLIKASCTPKLLHKCQQADIPTILSILQSKTIGDSTIVRFNNQYCPELGAAMALGRHSTAVALFGSPATSMA